jgi:hypothetical protein
MAIGLDHHARVSLHDDLAIVDHHQCIRERPVEPRVQVEAPTRDLNAELIQASLTPWEGSDLTVPPRDRDDTRQIGHAQKPFSIVRRIEPIQCGRIEHRVDNGDISG